MKIAVACDHGALNLKKAVIEFLKKNGHEPVDFGTNSTDSCDYPDFALPAKMSKINIVRSITLTPITSPRFLS